MKTAADISLKPFNSFGVNAVANNMHWLESMDDVQQLQAQSQPASSFDTGADLVLGGGSNILFTSDVPGTVYLNRIRGRNLVEEDGDSVLIEVAAGENWHEFVLWTLNQGYYGLENLSLIPGLVGAAPMQNIGAYGVEISNVLESVKALDWQSGQIVSIKSEDCGFSYRDSRFKSTEPDRFLILSCHLRLLKNFKPELSYTGLASELSAMNIKNPGAKEVSEAVIRIRQRKLPDPAVIANAGSFFKNPEIGTDRAEELRSGHKAMPVYRVSDEICKLSAAWMIEQCGWKGFRQGDAGVSRDHALVLVNHGQASGFEILELSWSIAKSVQDRFGITLVREPQVFGAIP